MVLLEDFAALIGLVFALLGVGLTLITGNGYWDVVGTALIGLLLVAVAVVLGGRDQEPAARRGRQPAGAARGSRRRSSGTDGVERVIHMKTLHLGPEELLVAAKIGVPRGDRGRRGGRAAIDAAERAIRAAEPIAQVIYLEPDIYVEDHVPDRAPRAARARRRTERPAASRRAPGAYGSACASRTRSLADAADARR